MRAVPFLVLSVAGALLLSSGAASAESQTVAGDSYDGKKGDITKMVADNGTKAVTTRVFGLGAPCGGAQYLRVELLTPKSKLRYFAEAGCYGAEWKKSLWFTSTGAREDATQVKCANFEFKRIKASGAYRVLMPRGCLDKAPNRVRVEAEGNNYGTLTGGHAGPTKVLARG